jgi:hypothetical protein
LGDVIRFNPVKGDHVFIETPPSHDKGACGYPYLGKIVQEIQRRNGKLLLETPRHTDHKKFAKLFLIENHESILKRNYFFADWETHYPIISNYSSKALLKKGIEQPWIPGINLITYKMLHGTYPEVNFLQRMIKQFRSNSVRDFTIHNMILQSNNVALIDQNDPREGSNRWELTIDRANKICGLLKINNAKKFEKAFWENGKNY